MEKIKGVLKECGVSRVGFCTFDGVKESLLDCRAKSRIPKDAKTVICCMFPYKVKENPPKNISRYAAIKDYHTVCGDILKTACVNLLALFPENSFEAFIDNSPVSEVLAFSHTGLGKVGQNGLFIDNEFGSFVFLGEIVTDLDLKVSDLSPVPCLSCGLCKKKCPVGLEKKKCLSLLSQKKGDLSEEEKILLKQGGSVFGCDICSEVCPENKGKKLTDLAEFISSYRDGFSPTEDFSLRPYTWRGEKVILRNYAILEEN